MNHENAPVPQLFPDNRQIIKTKTFGRAERDPPKPERKSKSESANKNGLSDGTDEKSTAQKEFSEYLEKNAALYYLEHEVIDDAGIVQIRVINSENGSIVRKIPPDNVIDNAALIRKRLESKKGARNGFDIRA